MRRKHQKTLEAINRRPTSGTIKWSDIEALFGAVGAECEEREGSRVGVTLDGRVHIFHRPHGHSPNADKGAVNDARQFLRDAGITE